MVRQIHTAEDLLRMPDDGFVYQLVGGEIRRMSPGGFEHGRIAMLHRRRSVEETATIHRSMTEAIILGLDDTLDGGDIVSGWTLPLRELFGD